MPSTALIIPNRNGGSFLDRMLPAIASQTLRPDKILIMDSSSSDGSPSRWRDFGAHVKTISVTEFNHGGTRGVASHLVGADTLIYMTQDAIPASPEAFEKLCNGLYATPGIGLSYGRQLPHPGASLLSAKTREFNYPAQSRIKRIDDVPELGIKTCFCSDAFAAYRRIVLEAVGGFPEDVIGTEDAHVAARMLLAGYAVHYVADAQVYHSHEYTPIEELRRYFDIGTFYRREGWLTERFGGASGEGLRLVRDQFDALRRSGQSWRAPEVLWRSALKLIGYRLGFVEKHLPLHFKRRVSMFPGYWKSSSL